MITSTINNNGPKDYTMTDASTREVTRKKLIFGGIKKMDQS